MRSTAATLQPPLPALPSLEAGTAALFLLLYLALEWVSYIHPMQGLNITPLSPQSALAVALLLSRARAWWVVAAAAGGGEWLVGAVPVAWPLALASAAVLTLGYWLTATLLARRLGHGLHIATRRDFAAFLCIVLAGALATAALHAGAIGAVRGLPLERMAVVVHRQWISDSAGLLVILPLLMALLAPPRRRAAAIVLRTPEWWAIAGVAVLAAVAVFARPAEEQFKVFYLLFVPVVWSAARFGLTGAVLASALVQLLLVAAVQAAAYRPLTVFELQLLMAAVAATGLLLGVTVDEREAAAARLRETLRLAAAGDMAAALAHELNQPLTALSTYARALQLLAQDLGDRHPRIVDVSDKLVTEAGRASEVVKRLRNFFRERRTELQPTLLAHLLEDAVDSQRARAAGQGVALEWHCAPGLPPLWLDGVQVALVLRNLVENALDSASAAAAVQGSEQSVRLEARVEADEVRVSVIDSGPGLRRGDLEAVFEPLRSTKPGGMGVGLAISRSIVEAHGGRLWAEEGPGGRFHLTLPIATQAP